MYAIFEDGSRQYKVSEGQLVTVDYREAEPGSRVEFNRVLLFRNGDDFRAGQPVIDGLRILAEVVDNPSTKLYIQHFRRRKNYRRLRGHRQHFLRVRVKHILLPGQEPPVETKAEAATPPAPAPAPETTPPVENKTTPVPEAPPAPAATETPTPASAPAPEGTPPEAHS